MSVKEYNQAVFED